MLSHSGNWLPEFIFLSITTLGPGPAEGSGPRPSQYHHLVWLLVWCSFSEMLLQIRQLMKSKVTVPWFPHWWFAGNLIRIICPSVVVPGDVMMAFCFSLFRSLGWLHLTIPLLIARGNTPYLLSPCLETAPGALKCILSSDLSNVNETSITSPIIRLIVYWLLLASPMNIIPWKQKRASPGGREPLRSLPLHKTTDVVQQLIT